MFKKTKRLLAYLLTVCMLLQSGVCASAAGQCPEGHDLVDGTFCEECGTDYEWYVRENGDNCVNEGHDWDMGVCIVCGTKRCDVEGHKWNNGTCSECYIECDHYWTDQETHVIHSLCGRFGDCQNCGMHHDHAGDENGICTVCYYKCEHQYGWTSGKCNTCGMACSHNWSDWSDSERSCSICELVENCSNHSWTDWSDSQRSCSTCGAVETCSNHSWSAWSDSRRSCLTCGTEETCSHPIWGDWSDSKHSCSICGTEETCSVHSWGDWSDSKHSCSICGTEETCSVHSWSDWSDSKHSCSICGMEETCSEHNWVNGVCSKCDTVCSHQWNTNGYCSICHINCTHSWGTDGKCKVCGTTCWHIFWQDGKCSDCGMPCAGHSWDENGQCENCYLVCEHTSGWTNGQCSQCGLDCTHNYGTAWENGICKVCGVACAHSRGWNSNTGKCNLCQYACQHPGWSEGKCSTCGVVCAHTGWNSETGTCSTCGVACAHTGWNSETGTCSTCGMAHKHTIWQHDSNRVMICVICHKACTEHNWSQKENGTITCDICGEKCDHAVFTRNAEGVMACINCGIACDHAGWTQNDAGITVCTTCGLPCYHDNWNSEDGTCMFCGCPCPHEMGASDSKHSAWYNGVCAVCKLVCTHSEGYDNSACNVCNLVCTHSEGFDNETCACKICSTVKHNFGADGVCTRCGEESNQEGGSNSGGGSVCQHNYQLEDGTYTAKCTKCDAECSHPFYTSRPLENGKHSATCGVCQTKLEDEDHIYIWPEGSCWACDIKMDITADMYATAGTPFPVSKTWNFVFFQPSDEGIYQVTATGDDDWELTVYTVDDETELGYATNMEDNSDAESSVLFCAEAGASYVVACNNINGYAAKFSILITKQGELCTEHTWKNGACQVCGKICKHTYQDVSGSDSRACSVCGVKCDHGLEIEKTYLTEVDGTPVKAGTHVAECPVCGKRTVKDCDYILTDYDGTPYCMDCKAVLQTNDIEAGETGATVSVGQYSFFKFVPTAGAVYAIRAEHACMPEIKVLSWGGQQISHATAGEGGICESEIYMFEGESYYLILIAPAGEYGSTDITLTVTQTDHTCQHVYIEVNMCKYCNAENPNACETHSWENGVCTVCSAECTHSQGWDGETGSCFTCRKACEHYWNADGMCMLCGYWCRHQEYSDESGWIVYWKDGVCEICKRECQHEFTSDGFCTYGCDIINSDHAHEWESNGSGKCSICQVECSHYLGNWVDGACQTCGKACEHDDGNAWWNGVCEICGAECQHVWMDAGYCRDCGMDKPEECSHSNGWTAGKCNDCGKEACGHDNGNAWSDGVCEICGKECQHYWMEEGYCRDCGVDKPEECTHSNGWTAGKCNDCGKEACGHDNGNAWSDGVCEICGAECQHVWMDAGYCRDCGMDKPEECTHSNGWTAGKCNDCGKEACGHDNGNAWSDGVCEICGKECQHYWMEEGYCRDCGVDKPEECTHSNGWTAGKCNDCGKEACGHDNGNAWSDGVCEICGAECQHVWMDAGYCRDCGVDKPEECTHSNGWTAGKCNDCGKEACGHDNGNAWEDGVCEICGKACTHVDNNEDDCCDICGAARKSVLVGSVLTTGTTSIAPISGGGKYYEGEEVTVTATAKELYTFLGWYEGDIQVCKTLSYTFTMSAERNLTAKYQANEEHNVTISCYDIAGFKLDGESDAKQTYLERSFSAGTKLTLVADATDLNQISGWYNGSGKLLGTGLTLEITVTGNMDITLRYKASIANQAMVEYISDSKQLLNYGSYTAEGLDDLTEGVPVGPSKPGYLFNGWDKTPQDIIALIAEGETHIVVNPKYEEVTISHSVKVKYSEEDVEITENIREGSVQSFVARDIEGKTFSYWKSGDQIVSYSQNYQVLVMKDLVLIPVYDEVSKAEPVLKMEQDAVTDNDNKLVYTFTYEVPEDYEVQGVGILYSTVATTDESLRIGENGVYQYTSTLQTKKGACTYYVVVGSYVNVSVSARGYIIVNNPDTGNSETLYAQIVSGSYNDVFGSN